MSSNQVITTTIFGGAAENLGATFGTFSKVPNTELHAFIYGDALPKNQDANIHYHLVKYDPSFVSVGDALFRRWLWPDTLGAGFALVVDGTDALCLQPLPSFAALLRGACVAGATEWGGPFGFLVRATPALISMRGNLGIFLKVSRYARKSLPVDGRITGVRSTIRQP